MSVILGINAFHAGAAAALLIDGQPVAAIAEERLNRVKYYARFPSMAIRSCLDMAGLDIYQAVGSYLNKELSTRGDVSPLITERTAAGRLGIKSGGGIFDYPPERIAELRQARAQKLVATRKALENR